MASITSLGVVVAPPASSASLRRRFKYPATCLRSPSSTFYFGPTSPRACYSSPTTDHGSVWGHNWNRRGLVFTATLPFLLRLYESLDSVSVQAAESGNTEYNKLLKDEIRKVVPKSRAAGVLRLVFHDAGTFEVNDNSGGMNGSIIYELERAENAGLKGPLKTLEKAKSGVEATQPVSWADLIAVAGAEAVSLCGGPTIPVALGRLDSKGADPDGKLPLETLGASALKESFLRKGLSTQELVALTGAHTLGSKGFGNPDVFDNSYFKILLKKPWKSGGMSGMIGLPSDRALAEDEECLSWIAKYAENQNLFFEDFEKAYIKLVNSGAKWRSL
ncbi:putative L-ascorbate peroxidase 6 [Humulus lupulus]|uniref:putative L-ascorbate peroxidase 6 n=1 Tax=Humulus lupulus TaxID=3486 RepID=UPI002B40B5B6|nr:putative L-ascorbate peroxidase 6 [Humulus lupulus]